MFGDELVAWVERSRKAAGLDVSMLSDGELMDLAVAAAQVASLADQTTAHALAELDARGTTVADCGLKPATWLTRAAGISHSRAYRALKVGRCLRHYQRVDHAVADTEISFDHAAVIANATNPRIQAGLAAVQDHLIDHTHQVTTFGRWQRYVERFADELDQDGPHDPDAELARNRLHLHPDHDGIRVQGRLLDEPAAVVAKTIDAKADELFRRYAHDHKLEPSIAIPDRATLRALALAEICRQANATPVASSKTANPDITLVIRADDPDTATDPGTGIRLQDGTTRTLRCDPAITALIVDGLGVPLDMGHAERLATAAQRRAIAVRDGGCVFPGCDRPAGWTAIHHVHEHQDGGPTDLANLAGLCVTGHHGLVHRTGWHMHVAGDGWFTFATPTGRTFWSQRHGRQRQGPTPQDDPHWATKVTDPNPPP